MFTFLKRSLSALAAGSVLFGALAFAAVPAMADGPGPGSFARPAVVGTVASVSGDTITVTAKQFTRGTPRSSGTPSTTTYTVSVSGATVTKDGKTSSVSAIAVGDMVMIQGTVSGTSVTATTIRDGMMMSGPREARGDWMGHASSTPPHAFASSTAPFTGNGEPVVGGTVSSVSGSTFTVTAKAGQVYTVDASSATFSKPGVSGATISNVSNGDSVVVQGAVNGTSVTASTVLDQGTPPSPGSGASKSAPHGGFLGGIGGFFSRLFGFF